MKGDIAFVGFMLTADEWQELDPDSRAQLIAVATRRTNSRADEQRPRRFPDGTGKHEIVESIDDELDKLIELDLLDSSLLEVIEEETNAALEVELARVDRDGDIALFADTDVTWDLHAQYDAIEEWLALQPSYDHTDLDEWVTLPEPAAIVAAPIGVSEAAALAVAPIGVSEPATVVAAPIVEAEPATTSAPEYEDFADWADL